MCYHHNREACQSYQQVYRQDAHIICQCYGFECLGLFMQQINTYINQLATNFALMAKNQMLLEAYLSATPCWPISAAPEPKRVLCVHLTAHSLRFCISPDHPPALLDIEHLHRSDRALIVSSRQDKENDLRGHFNCLVAQNNHHAYQLGIATVFFVFVDTRFTLRRSYVVRHTSQTLGEIAVTHGWEKLYSSMTYTQAFCANVANGVHLPSESKEQREAIRLIENL